MTGSGEIWRSRLQTLIAVPAFWLAYLLSLLTPRSEQHWVFGQERCAGSGLIPIARTLRVQDPAARICVIVSDGVQARQAAREGFEPVRRRSWRSFWATLRARTVIFSEDLSEISEFGVFGATVVQLGHGADPAFAQRMMDDPQPSRKPGLAAQLPKRMRQRLTREIALIAAGSIESADRIRVRSKNLAGQVRVLGNPGTDALIEELRTSDNSAMVKHSVALRIGRAEAATTTMVLYAPRTGEAVHADSRPTPTEIEALTPVLEAYDVHLVLLTGDSKHAELPRQLTARVTEIDVTGILDLPAALAAFDLLITDSAPLASDFALTGRPILWSSLHEAAASQTAAGLPEMTAGPITDDFEPLAVTAAGKLLPREQLPDRLDELLHRGTRRRRAEADSRLLAERFHAYPEGRACERVLAEILRMRLPDEQRVRAGAIFFESSHGREAAGDPLAIDREIEHRHPGASRYWSVTDERCAVPDGAIPLVVGSPDWLAARRLASLVIIDERFTERYRRPRGQFVLHTGRTARQQPAVDGSRSTERPTRAMIRDDLRSWSAVISQNPMSTAALKRRYSTRCEIWEFGLPRNDRLARAVSGGERIGIAMQQARRVAAVTADERVCVMATVSLHDTPPVSTIDRRQLALELGGSWKVLEIGDGLAEVSTNDLILAADVIVTDDPAIHRDASVARVPVVLWEGGRGDESNTDGLLQYANRGSRGTGDELPTYPGPRAANLTELLDELGRLGSQEEQHEQYSLWLHSVAPHDDGHAAERVVDELHRRGFFA